ncbi:MAG: hypothetical protein ACE5HD_03435 [Acidobacteriota bacterium]
MERDVDRVISNLNSIHLGDLDRIAGRLEEARRTLEQLDAQDLVASIQEAQRAIRQGDVPLFRRRVQHVVSRLGHLR